MASTLTWNSYFNTNAGITDRLWQQRTFARLTKNFSGDRALQLGFPDTETLNATSITMRVLNCDCVRFIDHDARIPVLAEASALPFEDASFDLITWPHGLDAAENAQEVLSEISRVLAPNGVLLTTFFNRNGSWKLLEKFGHQSPLPQGVAGVTVSEARALVADVGLTYTGGNYGVYAVNSHPENDEPLRLDLAGDRWWPALGNMIMLSAKKMDRTMTLVGRVNFEKASAPFPAVLAGKTQKTENS